MVIPNKNPKRGPTIRQWLIVAGVIGVIDLMLLLYFVPGSGFASYTPIKSGDVEVQRYKTLWDWLGLLVIPVVLAVGGIWFSSADRKNDRANAERRAEEERARADARALTERQAAEERERIDRELADAALREQALQHYLDRMADLITTIGNFPPQATTVARARTLTTLQRLGQDGPRKGSVIGFLHEAGLINGKNPVISLRSADLRNVNLSVTKLHDVNLTFTDMREAYCSFTEFDGADLRGCQMEQISLYWAKLHKANLSGSIVCLEYQFDPENRVDMQFAELNEAILESTHLVGVKLHRAKLRSAVLTGATLTEALLIEADLTGATLTDAVLTRTDLTGAIVTDQQLAQAKSLKGATMPDGSIHD